MELCVFTEPQQGATYETQLRHAQAAEALGFTGWFRSDHLLTQSGDGLPGPTDAWTALAGLARETSRVRLGTLVSSVTFRQPGLLAVQVAQVDSMSGGRVELGLGAGWFEAEHRAYGVPFPERRFDLLEEALEIVTGLWSTPLGDTYAFDGEHWQVTDSPALPKPVQERIPVIVGGGGPRRTPALAAEFATEYNVPWLHGAELEAAWARGRAAAAATGRDDLRLSVAKQAVVGRTEAEFRRRAEAIGADPERVRATQLGGTPAEVADRIAALGEAGAVRVYLQTIDMADLDHLALLAEAFLV
jgi:F420-dependent oxidoreductase-like protein